MEKDKKSPFLMNAWYGVALSTEVGPSELFHRKILGMSILIYRKEDGTAVAMRNRCPHRFLPLHLGKRKGDNVTCLYHALTFDSGGKCVHSPHGNGMIPKAAVIRSFPIVESGGFLWLWPGDPAKADPSTIIDCTILSRNPAASVAYAYMWNGSHYELLSDNIMDLTHVDHVHGPFINTGGKLSPLIPQVSEKGENIRIRWEWSAHPTMQAFAMNLADPAGPAENYLDVTWHAPANLALNAGAVQGSGKNFDAGINLHDFHIITPETETTSHYFFATTRDYKMEDAQYNDLKMAAMVQAFTTEDKPVVEAQQQEIETTDLWSLNPVLLSSDAGNVRVRRKLRALIEAEQKQQ